MIGRVGSSFQSRKLQCFRKAVMRKIPYAKPSITELEIEYVTDAIKHGWGASCYDYIYRFQSSFQSYLGVRHALATSSCTGALHLAYAALGIKEGDEVIAPDITWIASVAPLTYLKARPVFVDVLPDSWCIDPDKIEAAITPKTKAILVVHLYGNLVEMDPVLDIARKHGLPVVEDAAEALGSEYKGKKTGTMGDFGVFSFHGTKTVTTGEGGMLVSNSEELFKRAAVLGDHGRSPDIKKHFWMKEIGYKYKISNLQAAMGCAQLERAAELVDKKRQVFQWYREILRDVRGIAWNPEPTHTKNSFWMPTMIVQDFTEADRDGFMQAMANDQIQLRPFFYPLSSLPMFERNAGNKVSYSIYGRGINLPSYFELTQDDVCYLDDRFRPFIARNR